MGGGRAGACEWKGKFTFWALERRYSSSATRRGVEPRHPGSKAGARHRPRVCKSGVGWCWWGVRGASTVCAGNWCVGFGKALSPERVGTGFVLV